MKIIIIGCGRLGIELASRLNMAGADLAIVDNIAASFSNLPADFEGLTVEGEALNQDVLLRAGIDKADGLAAVTNCDPLNAVIGHIAKVVYNVPHIVVRNFDPRWRPIHESFHHQLVSSTSWGAQRIEELLYHAEVRTVYSAGNGEVEVYEIEVPKKWDGKKLKEVLISSECIPVSLTRDGRAFLPTPDSVIHADDVFHFTATMEGAQTVKDQILSTEGR
jgi:trk system potassium uptake protein TrkA